MDDDSVAYTRARPPARRRAARAVAPMRVMTGIDIAATTIARMRFRLVLCAALVLLVGCAAGVMAPMSARDVEDFVARHWRSPLAPQGPPPAASSALEASLAPEACGACHPAQLADWKT